MTVAPTGAPAERGRPLRLEGPIRPVQPATTAAAPGRRVRLVFVAIMLLALNLRGAVTVVPPLIDRITADLGLTPVLVGFLGALPTIAFATAGFVAARLLRRLPAERIAVAALVVTAAAQVARPWTGEAYGFLTLSAIALLAMGVGNVILPPLVKGYFPHRIGAMTAAYITALTVGTAVPASIAVPVATGSDLGWRLGVVVWASAALVALPLWVIPALRPRVTPAAAHHTGPRLPVHRSRLAWGLALLFGMNALNIYALITWLPVRLIDAGLSPARAGFELGLFTGIGVLPSLAVPILASRVRRTELLVLACVLLFAVGHTGILLAPTSLTSLWVILSGIGGGGFPLALTLFGLRSGSPAAAGALSGFAQGVGYALAALGPVVVGVLHDATGGWTAPFAFLGVTLVLMQVGGHWAAPRRTIEDDLARHDDDPRHPGEHGRDRVRSADTLDK